MLPILFCAFLAFADRTPLDAVILIEESPRTRIQTIDIPYTEGDRIAIMTFNSGIRLKQRFTDDPKQIARAIRAPWLTVGMFRKTDPSIRVLDAIAKANALFPTTPDATRRRAIVLLVASEEQSSRNTLETLQAAIGKTGAKLMIGALEGAEPIPEDEKIAQAPAPRNAPPAPVRVTRFPLPERTLTLLQPLATQTRRNTWELGPLLDPPSARD